MPRFYCPTSLSTGIDVSLGEIVARHLQVLRIGEGEAITLFDGQGGEYRATLTRLGKKHAHAVVGEFSPREVELPYTVNLAQALPEGQKMDWIIEKTVELGIAAIQPLAAQRSVVRLAGERAEKRHEHWQGIIVAASEQCGRNRLAQLAPLTDFKSWVAQPAAQPRILFSPGAKQSLPEWARAHLAQSVTLMIGPEGGFSPEEERAAVASGAILLTLGERVLRTETAGIAALAALSALWGSD